MFAVKHIYISHVVCCEIQMRKLYFIVYLRRIRPDPARTAPTVRDTRKSSAIAGARRSVAETREERLVVAYTGFVKT